MSASSNLPSSDMSANSSVPSSSLSSSPSSRSSSPAINFSKVQSSSQTIYRSGEPNTMNTFHSTNGSEQNHKDENESDRHTSDLSCKSRSPSQDAIYPVDKDGPANSSPLYDIYSDISDSDNNSNTSTSSHKNSTVEDIDLLKSVLTSHLPIPKVLDPQSASSSPRISPPAATHTPPTFTKSRQYRNADLMRPIFLICFMLLMIRKQNI